MPPLTVSLRRMGGSRQTEIDERIEAKLRGSGSGLGEPAGEGRDKCKRGW